MFICLQNLLITRHLSSMIPSHLWLKDQYNIFLFFIRHKQKRIFTIKLLTNPKTLKNNEKTKIRHYNLKHFSHVGFNLGLICKRKSCNSVLRTQPPPLFPLPQQIKWVYIFIKWVWLYLSFFKDYDGFSIQICYYFT